VFVLVELPDSEQSGSFDLPGFEKALMGFFALQL
jgi:hypothetical protein